MRVPRRAILAKLARRQVPARDGRSVACYIRGSALLAREPCCIRTGISSQARRPHFHESQHSPSAASCCNDHGFGKLDFSPRLVRRFPHGSLSSIADWRSLSLSTARLYHSGADRSSFTEG
jgi:hypothetical protein